MVKVVYIILLFIVKHKYAKILSLHLPTKYRSLINPNVNRLIKSHCHYSESLGFVCFAGGRFHNFNFIAVLLNNVFPICPSA